MRPPRVPSWGAFGRRPQCARIGHHGPASETLHLRRHSPPRQRMVGSGREADIRTASQVKLRGSRSLAPKNPPALENDYLTGKAPYRFESGFLQREVRTQTLNRPREATSTLTKAFAAQPLEYAIGLSPGLTCGFKQDDRHGGISIAHAALNSIGQRSSRLIFSQADRSR
jgi:hypothetical protein